MIICPTCREEIDDDSHFCDQCGQKLYFCNQCGRVGVGRRCTHCGGLMVSPDGSVSQRGLSQSVGMSMPGFMSYGSSVEGPNSSMRAMPVLALINDSLNIRINGMNGAIIGRRKGPYTQFFENQSYVSGVHAQLKFNPGVGWCVVDKHSSNGTMLMFTEPKNDKNNKLKNKNKFDNDLKNDETSFISNEKYFQDNSFVYNCINEDNEMEYEFCL